MNTIRVSWFFFNRQIRIFESGYPYQKYVTMKNFFSIKISAKNIRYFLVLLQKVLNFQDRLFSEPNGQKSSVLESKITAKTENFFKNELPQKNRSDIRNKKL